MTNTSYTNLIQRYLEGLASEQEIAQVEQLFSQGMADQELYDTLRADWETITPAGRESLEHLLDKIHHIIRLKEMQKQQSFRQRFITIYSRVAAILLVPILMAGLWYFTQPEPVADIPTELPVETSIYAPMGSRVAFNLPDGTMGFLNSGSTLTYTIPFASNRNVHLQGEAWFDVARDEQHPFEIGAGSSAVRVLGTSFNISAYPNESYVEVVLEEGSVEFQANVYTPTVQLKPSERMVFNGEKILIEETETAKYRGWTEGKLIFRGDNMDEVARRLERWYNIEVEVADQALNEYVFRATFEDDSLEEVLKLLSMTSPIRYRITPRQALPDGSWKKERVRLYKK